MKFLYACALSTSWLMLVQASLPALIPCAESCLQSTLSNAGCAEDDGSCLCLSEDAVTALISCAQVNCTVVETLANTNATYSFCEYPDRDQSQTVVLTASITIAMASFLVVVRFLTRKDMLTLGLDDALVLASITVNYGIFVVDILSTRAGLGRELWTVSPNDITEALKIVYVGTCLYPTSGTLVKLSFLAFYLRIFPGRAVRIAAYVAAAITTLVGISFTFAFAFLCNPVSFVWNGWDGTHKGVCLKQNPVVFSHAALSIALDILIVLIPLPSVLRLRLSMRKKIGTTIMFSFGLGITLITILRLRYLVLFGSTTNITYDYATTMLWSTLEVNIAIICVCLPAIPLALRRLAPGCNLFRSSKGTSEVYDNSRMRPLPGKHSSATIRKTVSYSVGYSAPHGDTQSDQMELFEVENPSQTTGTSCRVYQSDGNNSE